MLRGRLILRAMSWQDIATLAVLEQELFGADAWSPQVWWAELAGRPRRWYVVAEQSRADGAGDETAVPGGSGRVIGYAGLDRGGEVADVMTVGVVPDARGRGVGTLLLDALVEAARASGAAYVMLEVRADNDAARRLYERNGFSLLAIRRRYYQPGGVDAFVLRRNLAQETRGE